MRLLDPARPISQLPAKRARASVGKGGHGFALEAGRRRTQQLTLLAAQRKLAAAKPEDNSEDDGPDEGPKPWQQRRGRRPAKAIALE